MIEICILKHEYCQILSYLHRLLLHILAYILHRVLGWAKHSRLEEHIREYKYVREYRLLVNISHNCEIMDL